MTLEYKDRQQFPLRLAPSLRERATELAFAEGISLTAFINSAIVEKINRMKAARLEKDQNPPDEKT